MCAMVHFGRREPGMSSDTNCSEPPAARGMPNREDKTRSRAREYLPPIRPFRAEELQLRTLLPAVFQPVEDHGGEVRVDAGPIAATPALSPAARALVMALPDEVALLPGHTAHRLHKRAIGPG